MHTVGVRSNGDVDPVVHHEGHTAQRQLAQTLRFAEQVARGHVGFMQLDHVHATRERGDEDVFERAFTIACAVAHEQQQRSRRQTVFAGHGAHSW